MTAQPRPTPGLHIAILVGAFMLLAAAASHWIALASGISVAERATVAQAIAIVAALAAIVSVRPLRRKARRWLAVPLEASWWPELAALCAFSVILQFANLGLDALLLWWRGGDAAVSTMTLGAAKGPAAAFEAFTLACLVVRCVGAPLAEELVFRGFLFEAWSRRFTTLVAIAMTSTVFALVHPAFLFPFVMGIMLNALYVRTGSLRAPMVVHAFANLAFWYPLLGRFAIASPSRGLESWWLHLLCLAAIVPLVFLYVRSAVRRQDGAPAHTVPFPLERTSK